MSLELMADVFAHYIVVGAEARDRTVMYSRDLGSAMIALDIRDGADLQRVAEISQALDDGDGFIEFETFVDAMTVELENQNSHTASSTKDSGTSGVSFGSSRHDIMMDAYYMFTDGQDRPINVADLEHISREINDNASKGDLNQMIELFSNGRSSIDYRTFCEIMTRSGVVQ